jgi:hypothetical protein
LRGQRPLKERPARNKKSAAAADFLLPFIEHRLELIKMQHSRINDLTVAQGDDSLADLELDDLECLAEKEDCPWPVFDRLGDLAVEKGDAPRAISWYMRGGGSIGISSWSNC